MLMFESFALRIFEQALLVFLLKLQFLCIHKFSATFSLRLRAHPVVYQMSKDHWLLDHPYRTTTINFEGYSGNIIPFYFRGICFDSLISLLKQII